MPEYDIDFSSTGLSDVLRDLNGVAEAVEGLLPKAGAASVGLASGGIVALLGTAAAAVAGLGSAALFAANALTQFGKTQFGLGSSGETTAFLRSLGGALGISDVAGLAERIRSNTLSGLGAATASKFGIPIEPFETGQDRGLLLIRTMEELRKEFQKFGFRAAVRDARRLGAEELLPGVFMTDQQLARMREMAKRTAEIFSPRNQAAAMELRTSLQLLRDELTLLATQLGTVLLPAIRKITDLLANPKQLLGVLFPFFFGFGQGGLPGVNEAMRQAQERQTQALDRNSEELRNLQGIYGGRGRTRAAIPAGMGPGVMGGYALGVALRSHAVRLGSYAVGF